MDNSRQTAFNVLYEIFYNDSYSNIALDNALEDVTGGKAFVTRLVYGVTERKLTLDYIIGRFCNKTKPKVNIILMLGAYQLYFMDKVPSNAAINESVKLAKSNGLGFYSGLINAVLHKIDENRIDLEIVSDLSVKYSVPEHLLRLWNKAYGDKRVLNFLPCLNGGAPVFAVPNAVYVDAAELLYELKCENTDGEIVDGAVMITSALDLRKSKAFKNGLFHIEDLSCFNAVRALGVKENETVLDICSAPGGKAFTAAGIMKNKGVVYAYDLYPHRVELIKMGAERLGLTAINAEINDALIFNKSIPKADKIICDVPCSGFGVIRRKPEIRYKNLDGIKGLPDIQYRILKTSSEYLKKGGRLLYSTCTLNKRENEDVINKFISENSDYAILCSKTIFPKPQGGDGFFYSVIERK